MKIDYKIIRRNGKTAMYGTESMYSEEGFRLHARILMENINNAHYCEYSVNGSKRMKTIANF